MKKEISIKKIYISALAITILGTLLFTVNKLPLSGQQANILETDENMTLPPPPTEHVMVPNFVEDISGKYEKVLFYKDMGHIVTKLLKNGQIEYELPDGQVITEEVIGADMKQIEANDRFPLSDYGIVPGYDPETMIDLFEYSALLFRNTLNKIDLKITSGGDAAEKVFILKPGAEPDDIRVKITGANNLQKNEDGTLRLTAEINLSKPIAYQKVNGEKEEIEVEYSVLSANSYGFSVADYVINETLIIR